MTYQSEYPGTIHFEKKDHIAILTFDNPKTLNALSLDIFASINELFDQMAQDDDIYGVILTGAGRSFVAGADLSDPRMKVSDPSRIRPVERREQLLYIHSTLDKVAEFPRPVLAAINGYALGGGAELALCCDFRFASTKAKIGFPETHLGGFPGYTGPTRAMRILGPTVTKEMIFSSRHYTAEEALQLGFVSKVTEPEQLLPACEEYMRMLTKNSPMGIKYAKLMCNRCMEMSPEASKEFERMLVCVVATGEDWAEGMNAFKERRDPVFPNR